MITKVDERVAEIVKLRALGVRLREFISLREGPILAAMKVYGSSHDSTVHSPCEDCEPEGVYALTSDAESLYTEWECTYHCAADGEGFYVPLSWLRVYLAGSLET